MLRRRLPALTLLVARAIPLGDDSGNSKQKWWSPQVAESSLEQRGLCLTLSASDQECVIVA